MGRVSGWGRDTRTEDEALAARVAAGLVAGTCWVNTYWANSAASSNVPRRNSGTGAIDAGSEGLREWIVEQVVRPPAS